MNSSLFLALLLAGASPLAARGGGQGVGDPLPAVRLEGFSQTTAKSFDDFSGRAVMFEFFAYWCGPCARSVPHVKEIQERWGPKGLSVIGVTDESPSLTEPWISANKATYAYAYDTAGELSRFFRVSSIPRAIIVSADGTVLFNGHPSEVDDALLAKAVEGAVSKPWWEWSGAAAGVKAALQKSDFKSALDLAGQLGEADDGPKTLAVVRKMVQSRAADLRSAHQAGDFLRARTVAETLQKELAGLPEGAEAERIATEIAGDPKALEVIQGQQKLAKIVGKEPGKKKEWLAAIEDLQELEKGYPDTFVAKEARRLMAEYQRRASR